MPEDQTSPMARSGMIAEEIAPDNKTYRRLTGLCRKHRELTNSVANNTTDDATMETVISDISDLRVRTGECVCYFDLFQPDQ